MTGGRVVILGPTGRNFAAGMSGGIAYVLDEDGLFADRCNPGLVDLEPLVEPDDVVEAKSLIEKHLAYTGSTVAERVLEDWAAARESFMKVMPRDYKRVLAERAAQDGAGPDAAALDEPSPGEREGLAPRARKVAQAASGG